jgi:hypothetical protein
MDTASAMPPVPETLSPAIDTDLPCSRCDYNLKGLTADANCPECGQPIASTLRFGLIHSDPAWLRRQAAAVPWLAALCINRISRPDFLYPSYPVAAYIGHALNILAVGLALFACWQLSTSDARSTESADGDGSIRRGLRLAAIVLLGLDVATFPLFHRAAVLPYGRPTWLLSYALPIAFTATQFLVLLLLARHARRSGSRSLRTHARVLLYVFPTLPLVGMLLYSIPFFDLREFAEVAMAIYQTLGFLNGVALLAMLILLGRMYEVLRAAAAAAASASTS